MSDPISHEQRSRLRMLALHVKDGRVDDWDDVCAFLVDPLDLNQAADDAALAAYVNACSPDVLLALLDGYEALEQELARWKTCENCGEPLHGPGVCDKAVSEREKALELMHEETLTRAEQTEAERDRLAAQVRELSEWQPIESAPKDGTHVIVVDIRDIRNGQAYCAIARPSISSLRRWITHPGGWAIYPTHWRLLPAPPETAKE